MKTKGKDLNKNVLGKMFEFKHPNYYKKLNRYLTYTKTTMIRRIMMKKYKVRIFGLGIDAKALIPFPYEPT